MFKNIGPGALVAAAFIGPGTVTVCTIAGVNFGYALLWAMLLSIFATIILQEMAARLGVVSQQGLSEIIRSQITHPILKIIALILIISAIIIGNTAYEAGNISGGALGLETLFGFKSVEFLYFNFNIYALLIGFIAFVALYAGTYRTIERFLVFLVALMSLAFISTAVITKPNLSELLSGLFTPTLEKKSLLAVIGLIGTTVVPYNLFLHASLAKAKWKSVKDVKYARRDTIFAVVLGGVVSMSIIISAAEIPMNDISNASDLALSLEPLVGVYAKYFLSIGLFAAGITSAITAPLAAAYVASGCLGWSSNLTSMRFRLVWICVLGLGVLSSSLGFKAISIIKFAQVANGLLLPIIAIFLLWVMNNSKVLKDKVNTTFQNSLGLGIIIVTVVLGIKGILSVLDIV